jgi:hypothetical protein
MNIAPLLDLKYAIPKPDGSEFCLLGRLLAGYSDYLFIDGYVASNPVCEKDGMTQLACWAHARRGLEVAKNLQTKGKTGKDNEMFSLMAISTADSKPAGHASSCSE